MVVTDGGGVEAVTTDEPPVGRPDDVAVPDERVRERHCVRGPVGGAVELRGVRPGSGGVEKAGGTVDGWRGRRDAGCGRWRPRACRRRSSGRDRGIPARPGLYRGRPPAAPTSREAAADPCRRQLRPDSASLPCSVAVNVLKQSMNRQVPLRRHACFTDAWLKPFVSTTPWGANEKESSLVDVACLRPQNFPVPPKPFRNWYVPR
jgi:hypothetical protein